MSKEKILEPYFSRFENIHGWCTEEKANKIAELILERSLRDGLEIGVYGGKSLIPAALVMKHIGGNIVALDSWNRYFNIENLPDKQHADYWLNLDLSAVLKSYQDLIVDLELSTTVLTMISRSDLCVDKFENESLDYLHIDGNHSEKISVSDVSSYLPKMRKGGIVIFDDINWKETGIAVQLLLSKTSSLVYKTETYAVFEV